MTTPKRTTPTDKLTGEIQLARIRLARAESQLKTAKEQARLAKRRRKEAKEAARRAKKQARLAKHELAEAKLVLGEAEKKLALARQTAARAKARKKGAAKKAASRQNKQPPQPAASTVPKSPKPVRATARHTKAVSGAGLVPRGPKPGAVMSMPGNQASSPAGQAVEETPDGTAELAKTVEPGPEASQTQRPE
jgi:septal ring factor EnvC (AmiA/AmiB activator)